MLKKITVTLLSLSLISCAATQTSIQKRDLIVNTTVENSIFLEPMSPSKQIIFLKIRNTSSSNALFLQQAVKARLETEGFRVTNDPEKAFYMLQANVRQFTGESKSGASGIEGSVIGGALGSTLGQGSGSVATAAAGALVGGLTSTAINAYVQDIRYIAEVDVELSQRARNGKMIRYKTKSNQSNGIGNKAYANYTQNSNWVKYSTKIKSVANKVNLTQEEAARGIVNSITNSIAGML